MHTTTTTGSAAAPSATRTILRTDDFACPSCVATLERSLGAIEGVDAVRVLFATGRIEVEHDRDLVPVPRLVAAVAELGYRARPTPF